MTVGERLRQLRTQEGLTLLQASTRAGISLTFLSDVERGRTLPSLVALQLLADVYHLTAGEVLADVRIRPANQTDLTS